jgi:ankyrin repeat protein
MNRTIIKICGLICWAAIIAGSLEVGAMSDPERALQEIKRMKADRYFTDRIQAEFVTVIGRGDVKLARQLLAQGAVVDAVGSEGMTALYWAIAKQNFAGFRFLLEYGASPNALTRWTDADGVEQWASAIELAAMLEDSRYLSALLEAGADPNQIVNSSEQTAIYIALLHRRYDNAALLIENGADIDHQSKSLTNPIGDAVYQRAYASALFLLRAGANPTIKNRWGKNAVDTARQFGKAGTVIGSEDEAAYPEFVAELKRRGFWGDEQ